MLSMSMKEQAGVASANKKLAEKIFKKCVREIEEVKYRVIYDEEDFQKIKGLRRDTDLKKSSHFWRESMN